MANNKVALLPKWDEGFQRVERQWRRSRRKKNQGHRSKGKKLLPLFCAYYIKKGDRETEETVGRGVDF